MAVTGIIYEETFGEASWRVKYTSVLTTDKNTSKVTVEIQGKSVSGSSLSSNFGNFSINIYNDNFNSPNSGSGAVKLNNDWATVFSHSTDVGYALGIPTIKITVKGTVPLGASTTSFNKTLSVTLQEMQASTIYSVSGGAIASILSVSWIPKKSDYTYKVKLSLEDWEFESGIITPKTTNRYSYTKYLQYDLATYLPNSATGKMVATLYSYDANGNPVEGEYDTHEVTITVPENSATKPTVSIAAEPIGNLIPTFDGLYIQGKTKVKVSIDEECKYGATVNSKEVGIFGQGVYNASEGVVTSNWIVSPGSLAITGTVQDSRGFTGEVQETINVIPYSPPAVIPPNGVNAIVCKRCNEDGTINDSGTNLRIIAGRTYSKVLSDGVQKNFCVLRYRHKTGSNENFSEWIPLLEKNYTDSDVIDIVIPNIVPSLKSTYVIQISVVDDIGENPDPIEFIIPTDFVTFDFRKGGKGFAFGKYSEIDNCIEIADGIDIKVHGDRWNDLGLFMAAKNVSDIGRKNGGCFYRVENGNHVIVTFACDVSYTGKSIVINNNTIQEEYRPKHDVYALNPTSNRAIALIKVTKEGQIVVDWIQNLETTGKTSSAEIEWIDGYIDYWI